MLPNFPKIECPFIRKNFNCDPEDFKKYRSLYNIRNRKPVLYLVINEINPGYEWVLEDSETFCTEKLNGTNIQISVENNHIVHVQNRLNTVDLLELKTGFEQIPSGIFYSVGKGYFKGDGEHAGELVGPKLQGNPYKLLHHEYYPFPKAISELRYKSFHSHERNFDNWSNWFKSYLFSLFYAKRHKIKIDKSIQAEGVVFYNLKRKAGGKISWMAKLRRDMFPWYYDKIRVLDPVETR